MLTFYLEINFSPFLMYNPPRCEFNTLQVEDNFIVFLP